MKTVIIGGSGFIGTNLINLLNPTSDILNLDKNQSWQHSSLSRVADVRDKGKLEEYIPYDTSAVILLAAEHRDDVSPVSLYYDVNVQGTQNVIDTCIKKDINKIIFTSSVAVYGLNSEDTTEDATPNPFNHYGKSKLQAEQLLVKWQEECPGERTLIVIRPTVVFGPGNKGNVYNLLNQLVNGKFMMVGKGHNKKSLAYVDNVSGFIEHCLNNINNGSHIFNYVDNPDYSVNELLLFVEKVLKKKLPPIRIPYVFGYSAAKCIDLLSKITNTRYAISSVRIKKFCATTQFSGEKMLASGYSPKITLQEGLNITIDAICSSTTTRGTNVKVMTPSVYHVKEAQS
ncbi:NAD-dependent epimerase/dehydratase family protein [Aridibaculum aurantiacum]|uniref:NAD-dependent epimerase/dehydratase family protein n=1 Tax=Aridibaculum aurantiacum TaxID=2810307 RepID=UPI001A977FD4|nr:NAD-dependent epimerase/dehydratase family protein [Aridibaculum aurantiacum]